MPCEISAASLRPRSLHGGLLTGFVALIHTANDLFTTGFAALLPSLQARFELTEASVAVVVGALWMSASLIQPVFGSLACRVGRRTVAAAGLALTSVLLSLVAVVPAFYLLLPLVLLGGLGSAALHPVGTSLSRSAGGTRPGLAVGVFGAAGELGFALGPVVMLYVVSRYGLAAAPWLMLPGVALAALALVLIPKDQPTGDVCPAWLDTTLLRGPVGRLVGASVLINVAFITAMSAVPIWMVRSGALAVDSPLIAWTLFVFSLPPAQVRCSAACWIPHEPEFH